MKKSYIMLFCLITMLLTITAISATNTTITQDNNEISSNQAIIQNEIQSTTDNNNAKITNDKTQTIKEEYTTTKTQVNKKDGTNIEKTKENTNTKTQTNKDTVNTKTLKNADETTKVTPNTFKQDTIKNMKNNSDIYFSKGTYYLNSTTIDKNINIIGENKENTILIANSSSSIFNITKNSKVSISNITLKDYTSYTSAAISNDGILTVDNCIFQNNSGLNKTSKGGSIYNTATLNVHNSKFMENYASWGASIYNNNGTTLINASEFTKDNTLNVGGSVYNIRGTMTVYNSLFTENTAVSGAGIYNAFGRLYVNKTEFIKNSAISFYGGAIYSTGIVNVNNSEFLYNNAVYDGGAITNTNNFTANNCRFEANVAGGSGGAIENIAWTATENGNLTLINCTFSENSATVNGGAIVNLNTTPVAGNYGTITARNCVFESNSAGDKGGAICNDQYINLENNAFVENDASTGTTIYSLESGIKSVENNWWSANNPKWNKIGVTPKTWVVMTFTNTTTLLEKLDTNLKVTLNTLNNGKKLTSAIPQREVIYLSTDNATFKENFQPIKDTTTNVCTPNIGNISAKIDGEKISLQPIEANITYKLIDNNQTLQVTYNLPQTINGKTVLKINGITKTDVQNITNGKLVLKYDIPTYWNNKNYDMTVILRTNDGNTLRKNIVLTIPKRNVDAKISIISSEKTIKAGDTVKIVAQLTTGNKNITGGKVAFKINGKTIKTNISVVNGIATINYTIPSTFSPKNYNISIQYSGTSNKNAVSKTTVLKVSKQNVHVDPKNTMYLLSGTKISSIFSLLDSHNNYVSSGKVCYKINNKTIKTNITVRDGVFTFNYITPEVPSGKTVQKTLTIVMGANKKYNEMRVNIPVIIF